VHAIEYILFIAFGVYDCKLGWIEEPATVQSVGREEVSPLLASVAEVKASIGRAETSVRSTYRAMWGGKALTRTGRDVDHNTCLLAEFSRRRTGDDLHRLDRIEGNLV